MQQHTMRVLITGANRGLGLEFVKQFLERGDQVIATYRNSKKARKLQELKEQFGEALMIQELDVSSQDSINTAFTQIKQSNTSLDLLINNARIISGD